jgi:glycosyltransferase involved in cell wall biosynthesis
MTRVLVLTADVLRPQMAGPAMRAWHIADHLAAEHEVRLVTTSPYCEISSDRFVVAAAGTEELAEAEAWSDVMVLQGYVTHHHPVLATSQKIIVFDVYDPLHLETLALTKGAKGPVRDDHVRLSVDNLNRQLRRADFLMCASERQRDLYIGQLCALGRANALTYDHDPTLRSLIDVVPFGLPDDPPKHDAPALRGVVPGIGPDDDVLIWAGGVYDWFDPLTLVRAVGQLREKRPSVRLFFMGMRHPNPDVPPMQMAISTRALAEELGLTGKHVFFNDGWVEYAQRQNFLMEATLGVTMHFDSAETRFAFRTRALDYLWVGLPVVTTEGDWFAELVDREGLGLSVPPEDPDALADALYRLLSDPAMMETCRERAMAVRPSLRWSVVLEPLAAFCRQPQRAPDLLAPPPPPELPTPLEPTGPAEPAEKREPPSLPVPLPAPVPSSAPTAEPVASEGHFAPAVNSGLSLIELARHHYRQGGLVQVVRRAASKAERLARQVAVGKEERAG